MSTYTKLKNGDWGVRVTGVKPREGDRITVTKKDGSTKTEVVERVVWSGDGVHLCPISRGDGDRPSRGGRVCAECGRGGKLVADLEDGLLKHYRCCDIPPDGY